MKKYSGRAAALFLWIFSVTVLWPLSALAHVSGDAADGFFTGILHPVSGFDHVLAMLAVGLWGAQLGNRKLITSRFAPDLVHIVYYENKILRIRSGRGNAAVCGDA